MERSQECEGVILVPPLQFNEGYLYIYSQNVDKWDKYGTEELLFLVLDL